MGQIKKIFLVGAVSVVAFFYGSMAQEWNLFPNEYAEKVYYKAYFEYEEYKDKNRNRSRSFGRRTSLHEVEVEYTDLTSLKRSVETSNGSIGVLGSGLLVASNTGEMFYMDQSKETYKLEISLPFSRGEFDDVARSENLIRKWFGVKDLLVLEQSSSTFQVFASSHHWNTEEHCYTLQFETAVLEREAVADFTLRKDWKKIYETSPCLPLKEKGHAFAGHQAGGRIQARTDKELLLTVGDHGFDGYNGDRKIITDITTSYGKVLSLDLRTGESSVVSVGHRNPQGLYIDPEGRIWSTEHGPEGGDELNLINSGENYGWPYVTNGTQYGMYTWPPSDTSGAHVGYRRPIHAWIPSIAVSELTGVEGDLFSKWEGDLLIASLKKNTLYRTRVHEGRVLYIEPIELEHRLRDIVEMDDGTIAIKTDDGGVLTLRPKEQKDLES